MSPRMPAPRPTEELGRAYLQVHDYEQVGPFPGSFRKPWHVRCLRCDAEPLIAVKSLQDCKPRMQCRHAQLAQRQPAAYRTQEKP